MAKGVELSVEGRGLKDLQRKIKVMEDRKVWSRELNKGLREASLPLVQSAKDAARDDLPHAGGLNERVASRPTSVLISQGKMRLKVKGVDAASANRGRLRHPVYGNRGNWVTQAIPPGYFTNRMRRDARLVRPALVRAMDRVAEKIANA